LRRIEGERKGPFSPIPEREEKKEKKNWVAGGGNCVPLAEENEGEPHASAFSSGRKEVKGKRGKT